MLPNLQGEFRTLCLEILHSRIDCIENAFLELKAKGILTSLTHRNEETQQVSLKIIKAILSKLKAVDLQGLMSAITAFSAHPSTGCRLTMYEILMWTYDNYRDENSPEANKIMLQTKESLLKGLGDEDLHCRLQVQNFWSSEDRLPVGTLDRLVAMLEAMYSPVTEQQYLSYATNLLLEMTSKRLLCEVLLAPSTCCNDPAVCDTSESESSHGNRRSKCRSACHPGCCASQSSLMFTVGTGDPRKTVARRPKAGPGFGNQKLGAAKTSTSSGKKDEPDGGSDIYRLKRRFLKDAEQTRVFFAKRQTRLKEMREIAHQEQQARRESQVTMYRKYRSGDLPDIQIKFSYIIAPLQALAHRDSTIAKLLFSGIFEAIFANMEDVKTEREMGEVIGQIGTSLDNVLTQSTVYFPPFVGCVLVRDILYKLRSSLKVEMSSIGSSALASHLEPLGIALVEELLITQEPIEPRMVSKDVEIWIELSRLYKSTGGYDVLLGIFSGKIGTQPITRQAMEAEARGDYHTARKLYDEAMNCTDWDGEGPKEAEIDLWEDCRMQELRSKLMLLLQKEHFLPYMMRSKVKLLLQGDERQQPLLDFMDASMKVPEHKLVLENEYSQELALMYLWQEDYDRARHYCNTTLDAFLQCKQFILRNVRNEEYNANK
ncbi:PRKDC-like protein [Mya arenaria]|uniref:PRKDC-like protein n=1 Tax=Mya arenaria TaxID=6604 RepID=A0ABY7DE56_MYAAR|nr:PRKDC-like protein [Mya arenaria]